MKEKFSVGNVVKSVAGRDKGRSYLVVGVDENKLLVVDGRARKVNNPKRKNEKHLSMVSIASVDLAIRIQNGESVGNKKVYRVIKAENKKQED